MAATNYPFVSSFGGQGLVKTGAFSFPQYVAVDEAGNVYVTDLGNFRVQKFDNEGVYRHSWGSKGTDSKNFQSPAGIAVRNNFVYVVDHELNTVKKFDTTGNFILSWGSTGTEPGKFKLPNGVAVSKDDFVYVVDTGNSRVQKFDSEGKHIKTIGASGTEQGKFLNPLGIAADNDGNIYVGDAGNKRVQKFTAEGAFVKSYTASSGGIQISPDGVAVDSSGNIIIADAGNNRVVVLNKEGSVLATFGTTGTSNGQFKLSKDVAVDSDGDLFVVDSSNHRIQKFGSKDTMETTQTQTETQMTKPIANDFKKPDITPPKDLYVEATGGLTKVSIGMAIANDESGIKSLTSNAPTEFPLGITTVIWTAIDNAGNVGIATQTVTVGDSTPPVFSNLSDVVVEAKSTQNEIILDAPIVTDLVGVLSVTNDAPEKFPLGETIVTWTATDVAKNTATAIQKVTVIDTKAPKINAPANITIEATSLDGNQVNLGEPTVSDNSEIASITNDAPTTFPLGETIVTWSAVDVAGNVSTDTQKINIVDTTKPVIAQPKEVVVEAVSATANPVLLEAPSVSDVQAVTITNNAPELFPLGNTQVTWIAVDGSGNNATVTQSVTVIDTVPPNLTVPADITQEATGQTGNIVTLGDPIVDDITGISSISNNAPSDYPFGTTVVTWTATDNYGNSISKNQTVTIVDTTKPEITPPKDVTAEASSISENVVILGEPKVSDLVEIDSITHDAPSAFPLGQTTVTWTVTDSSGNTATATQLVSIIDTTAPAITVPKNIVVEATGSSGTSVSIGEAEATDAIGVESITNNSPVVFSLGTTMVTWSAVDMSGNIATAIQNVTVVDTTAPTITPPADITIEATSADGNQVTLGEASASDTVSLFAVTNDAPEKFPLGETIVTWTATDEAGNSATATQLVKVVDTTAPKITVPQNIVIDAIALETPVSVGTATAFDLTDSSPQILSNAPTIFPLGETIVTWTAVDKYGNSINQTQSVIVQACGKPHSSYNQILGTEEDDTLLGTTLADLIFGFGGDDIIIGDKGNDCIFGGDGDDIIYGNEGDDTINGDNGADIIKGQSGQDTLNGGSGTDIIDGGDDNDSCTASEKDGDIVAKCES
ncbi:MAG: HYR domain-containing protein [Candidatus Nitrosotenuis sp.]